MAVLGGLVFAYVAKQMAQRPEPVEQPGIQVVVARVNLRQREQIDRRALELADLRAGEPSPPGYLTNLNIAVARFTKQTIPAGEVITEDMLYSIGENPIERVPQRITEGMRAHTIQVAGLVYGSTIIGHDSIVDISLTVESDHPEVLKPGLPGIFTKPLMQNIRVLAVVIPPQGPRGNNLNDLTTIVVEVTPDQTNELTLAEEMGMLSVSIVGSHAGVGPQDDIVDPNQLVKLKKLPTPPAPPDPPVAAEPYRVEVYRGSGPPTYIQFGPDKVKESKAATAPSTPEPDTQSSTPASQPGQRGRRSREPSRVDSQDSQYFGVDLAAPVQESGKVSEPVGRNQPAFSQSVSETVVDERFPRLSWESGVKVPASSFFAGRAALRLREQSQAGVESRRRIAASHDHEQDGMTSFFDRALQVVKSDDQPLLNYNEIRGRTALSEKSLTERAMMAIGNH
ncbi:MAG: Flp pilus assembly protein CpaB [Planctomycetaceae bacterium]|nr:Flp pilus assembly protein CpaB [Planctomycetaceae bacterium]MBP61680.1 Flp pilus assembly protein CpaB [Planctomycetaceae bacterium]